MVLNNVLIGIRNGAISGIQQCDLGFVLSMCLVAKTCASCIAQKLFIFITEKYFDVSRQQSKYSLPYLSSSISSSSFFSHSRCVASGKSDDL